MTMLENISNNNLFELKNSTQLQISSKLSEFLAKTKYPWYSLGKSLEEFIINYIASIAQEDRLLGEISDRAFLHNLNAIVIGKNARIEDGAYICGPCIIEEGAIVRHGAYIRGYTYIGINAIIGHASECKNSILLPYAKAAHFNYLGDSILGYNCNLGAGTKLANLKFDHKNIKIKLNADEKIDTNLKKFGAILGNRAQTGCNSVSNPGTIIMPDATLFANQTVTGILLAK